MGYLEDNPDFDYDDYRVTHWLSLSETCCKEPCSFTSIFCTACNIVDVIRMSRRKGVLVIAFILFVATSFGILGTLLLF